MSLQVGSRLGQYDVTALIGEGGMGQVYQATDTTLDRDVALKVLPDAFTADPDRLARFEREAKVLASLNHPNIGAIYGLEKSGDTRALVLELIEGPTLADRIAKGPIPLDEALPIAKQIAEALEAAHEAGVIHRDLKPANIKVRDDGTVKVLDFGLAKALDPNPEGDPSQSPTLTAAATQMGVIMGTAAYMSPEQASGETTDKRSDVWSFGVVLFEMLTGQRMFEGKTVSHVLGAVLQVEPTWDALPTSTPPVLRRVLRRCLEKDRKCRLRDIGDTLADLDEAVTGPLPSDSAAARVTKPGGWQRVLPWVAGFLLAVATGFAGWILRPDSPERLHINRFVHVLSEGQAFTRTGRPIVALSPDGRRIAYVADRQLYLRSLDELGARPIQGTHENPTSPFFSPDGEWVGFWSDGQLKRISIAGGTPVTLCEADNPFGASWGADDVIVYGQPGGVMRVSANGGVPERF